jgi:hypothetical protein
MAINIERNSWGRNDCLIYLIWRPYVLYRVHIVREWCAGGSTHPRTHHMMLLSAPSVTAHIQAHIDGAHSQTPRIPLSFPQKCVKGCRPTNFLFYYIHQMHAFWFWGKVRSFLKIAPSPSEILPSGHIGRANVFSRAWRKGFGRSQSTRKPFHHVCIEFMREVEMHFCWDWLFVGLEWKSGFLGR